MNKHQMCVLGLFLFGVAVLAQDLPRTLPSPNRQGYYAVEPRRQPVRRNSCVNGKECVSVLEQPTVSREWEASAGLPLSLSQAEKIARVELSKIVTDGSEWVATDFQISRFGADPNWYYAVTLQPVLHLSGEPPESFTALMDFAGTPGRVFQLGRRQMPR
jgi:hypothetical protein